LDIAGLLFEWEVFELLDWEFWAGAWDIGFGGSSSGWRQRLGLHALFGWQVVQVVSIAKLVLRQIAALG
jgi:hypothetical protein